MFGGNSAQKKSLREFFIQFSIGVGLGLFILLFTQDIFFEIAPLKRLELATIDLRFLLRGPIPTAKESSSVIIVEISQESFKSLPDKWPWPRSYYARLIRNLKRAGALAVGIDIVFSEPDAYSARNDEDFRRAIQETGIVLLAGKTEISSEEYTIRSQTENYSNMFFSVDSSIGIVYVRNDEDGVYRRYRPFAVDRAVQLRIPSFSFGVLNKVFHKPPFYVAQITPDAFLYTDRVIPKFDPVSMLINYYGPAHTFRHIKFADVIDDHEFKTVDEAITGEDVNTFDDPDFGYLYDGTFKDKIALVGSTLPEDKDLFTVSMAKGRQAGDNLMYGVEIHANTIQNILDRNFLRKVPRWAETLFILLMCTLTFFATTKLKELKFRYQIIGDLLGALTMLVLLAMITGGAIVVFAEYNLVATMTSPALAVVLGFVGATVYNFITERKQKVLIKGMFSTYVNPNVVNEIVANPEKLKLGGERKELTVLFSDIEGFTTIAEDMEPEVLVPILNEYLTAMTSIIFAHEGTLDKYEGDAIMAFWGAPIPQPDHALRACRTAVDMQRTLVLLREEWKKENKPVLKVRIGLNTGEMIVGNMGGVGRFDYTIIGDSVNLGSRLEGANKQYQTNLMIGERTYELVKDYVIARPLDLIVVKGKTEPVAVHEVLGMVGDNLPPERLQILEMYKKGLQHYRSREWQQSMDLFEKVLEIDLDDYPSYLYLERASIYLKTPPPPEWNGVFILRTK